LWGMGGVTVLVIPTTSCPRHASRTDGVAPAQPGATRPGHRTLRTPCAMARGTARQPAGRRTGGLPRALESRRCLDSRPGSIAPGRRRAMCLFLNEALDVDTDVTDVLAFLAAGSPSCLVGLAIHFFTFLFRQRSSSALGVRALVCVRWPWNGTAPCGDSTW